MTDPRGLNAQEHDFAVAYFPRLLDEVNRAQQSLASMYGSEWSGFFGECHFNPMCPSIRLLGQEHFGVPPGCEDFKFNLGMVLFYRTEEMIAQETDDVAGMSLYQTKFQLATARFAEGLGLVATNAYLSLSDALNVRGLIQSILGINATVQGS